MLVSHRLSELAEHADRSWCILDGRASRTLDGGDRRPRRSPRSLVVGAGRARPRTRRARPRAGRAPLLRCTA